MSIKLGSCVAVKTSSICSAITNTFLKCVSLNAYPTYDDYYYKTIREFIIYFPRVIDTLTDMHITNPLFFKSDRGEYQIGGYKQKYLKYKHKYLMLKK